MSNTKKKSSNLLDRITECDQSGRRSVDISHLELADWPAELLIVSQVTLIQACKNNFSCIKSLGAFKGLLDLDISRNFITSLEGIDLSKLVRLQRLDISRNLLEHLPEEITQLPQLEVLMCHRNKLLSLPADMKQLKRLKVMDASHNNLTEIGLILESNSELEDLNITNNEDLIKDDMGPRARRLLDKRALLSSKTERRTLITRALGISRKVLAKEQQVIFNEFNEK